MEYDDETPSVTLKNGEVHTADVIVAVDGRSLLFQLHPLMPFPPSSLTLLPQE
jgi:2-polyprenyl-6-methoxyphenol hydroxylase-like FAD-dependent oxidoreductase